MVKIRILFTLADSAIPMERELLFAALGMLCAMDADIVETRISVTDLEIGMYVTRLDRPWLETDFPIQGFIVTCREDLEALRTQCEFVYVEGRKTNPPRDERSRRSTVKRGKPSTPRRPIGEAGVKYINNVGFEAELGAATDSLRNARTLAKDIIASIRLGSVIDANRCRRVVSDTVDSVLRNNQALLWLTQIKHKDDYTAEHSLNVCILAAAFGRFLGMPRPEIERLALCGLLHDVGKIRVREEVLNKNGPYTPREFEEMKRHPTHGRDILMSVSGLDPIAVDVAYSHHERPGGEGYPRNLAAEQIPYFAKIIAVVDAYDAITSHRCYDRARPSQTALDIIYRCRGEQFDEPLALSFIQCIGIYPPGAIVEMTNGEIGIVLQAHPDKRLRPRILLTRDANQAPRRERVIDLAIPSRDADGRPYAIARELPNHSHDIDLESYLADGLILTPPSQARL